MKEEQDNHSEEEVVDRLSDIDRNLATKKYRIFPPGSTRNLLYDWPQLQSVREFMVLSDLSEHLLFVWYFANRTSDLAAIEDEKERIDRAIKEAFGKKADKEIYKELADPKNWSDEISAAVERMKRIRPEARVRVHLRSQLELDTCQMAVERANEIVKSKKSEPEDLVRAINIIEKTSRIGQSQVATAEAGGYGVVEVEEDDIPSMVSALHSDRLVAAN